MERISLAWNISWSRKTYRAVEKKIQQIQPDIVHICNTFPLISPSIYFACRKYNIPVVQTVQNYRIACAAGLFFRDNKICEKCINHSKINAIKYGCYKNSRLQTVPIVAMQLFHNRIGTWTKYVDIFVAATQFSRDKLIHSGLPRDCIMVKPNFFEFLPEPSFEDDNYAIFLGRLSVEKGVRTLLRAWKLLPQIPVKIVGEGILRKEVESAVKSENTIEFLGHCSHDRCLDLIRRAKFLVMPSEWYEGFPITNREAFALGKPVVASRMGAMAEIVTDGKTGLLFEPGSHDDLAQKVQWLVSNKDAIKEMGMAARDEFEIKYTPEKNYEALMNIYQTAIELRRRRNITRRGSI
jgi:glycosyltransferase involved in cell wall biosynthesis